MNAAPPNTTSPSVIAVPTPSSNTSSASAFPATASTPSASARKSPSACNPPKSATPKTAAATSSKPNNYPCRGAALLHPVVFVAQPFPGCALGVLPGRVPHAPQLRVGLGFL